MTREAVGPALGAVVAQAAAAAAAEGEAQAPARIGEQEPPKRGKGGRGGVYSEKTLPSQRPDWRQV